MDLPDWSGETCAILACGPSATREQAEKVRGKTRAIAINRFWEWAPWADALYACDPGWWRYEGDGYGAHAMREFKGRKFGQQNKKQVFDDPPDGLELFWLKRVRELITTPGVIGSCDNGGFQAINVGYHFGCRRFLLLGFDMQAGKRAHCHDDHPKPMGNPGASAFDLWNSGWHDAEVSIRAAGVELINCTPGSRLTLFPMMSVEEALAA